MKILEVGVRTGAAAAQVLNALSQQGEGWEMGEDGPLSCEKYDSTDISTFFFERARATFSHIQQKIQHQDFQCRN